MLESFRFLFKKGENGKWRRVGLGMTAGGNFIITIPGTYRTNTSTDGWWGTPTDAIEVTAEMIADGLGKYYQGHGFIL